jgi:dipeptidyl aminopeptidase/acylaminoacyl peptidase
MRAYVLKLFACLVLACALQGTARAQVQSPGAPRVPEQRGSALIPPPARIEQPLPRSIDCFTDIFASYDRWMAFLREKNSWYAYLAIRWKFPREEFERYRRGLDCRAITYRSDGHLVGAWLVQPKQHAANKRLPVIVYNRGGNRSLGALTFAHLFTHVLPLAEQGYIVTASQYRGVVPVPGEVTSPDEFGGADVHDVTQLTRIVAALPQADATNVFMIGQSRGSIMTFRALLDSPVPIRAVAIYSGVYDLRDLIRMRPDFDGMFQELIPGYARHREVELDKRSVNRWPSRLPASTGVLLIHGEDDERAPLGSARRFAVLMKKLGRPHKAIFYPGESHFLDGHVDEVHAETLAWFKRFRHRPAGPAPAVTAARSNGGTGAL